jgi:outer membrane protein TolC
VKVRSIAIPLPLILAMASLSVLALSGCHSPGEHRDRADQAAYEIITDAQQSALDRTEPFTIERAEDLLRQRLLLEQGLPHAGPQTLGVFALSPIPHWPNDSYLELARGVVSPEPSLLVTRREPLRLSLVESLQVAAANSREYQNRKEQVFTTALGLDLQRNFFRTTWTGLIGGGATADLRPDDTIAGLDATASGGFTQRFQSGVAITTRIGVDLVRLLTQDRASSAALFGDASVTVPLLRGSGRHIVAEPLTQAERNTVYAIYDFERFKSVFAVDVANQYLSVLSALDRVQNAEDNYRRSILSARRSRRLADAGQLSPYQVAQAVQRELRARTRWVSATQSFEASLDNFKALLGLPTDAWIELDRDELVHLRQEVADVLERIRTGPPVVDVFIEGEIPPADAEIIVAPVADDAAGPFELPADLAARVAIEHRPDLTVAIGRVYDAQRGVVVAADALGAELTLLGSVATGQRRSLGTAGQPDSLSLPLDRATYDALLTLDLPLERTGERIAYRQSLIALERTVRDAQALEDQVKLQVRSTLRDLREAREALRIQSESVALAERQVDSVDLLLQAGRAQIRDLLEAQDNLVAAQDALTAALVTYRVAELRLQRDMGVLQVDERGLWREFDPQEVR